MHALEVIFLATALMGSTRLQAGPPGVVKVTIESDPPGATLIRQIDLARLGQTPVTLTRVAVPGQRSYVLRLDGHEEAKLSVSGSSSVTVKVKLKPLVKKKPALRPPAER